MKRRNAKYSEIDNSAARRAYNRHKNEVEPDDVNEDFSPEILDKGLWFISKVDNMSYRCKMCKGKGYVMSLSY